MSISLCLTTIKLSIFVQGTSMSLHYFFCSLGKYWYYKNIYSDEWKYRKVRSAPRKAVLINRQKVTFDSNQLKHDTIDQEDLISFVIFDSMLNHDFFYLSLLPFCFSSRFDSSTHRYESEQFVCTQSFCSFCGKWNDENVYRCATHRTVEHIERKMLYLKMDRFIARADSTLFSCYCEFIAYLYEQPNCLKILFGPKEWKKCEKPNSLQLKVSI